MKQDLYCIYSENNEYPYAVSAREPDEQALRTGDRICIFNINLRGDVPVSVKFDEIAEHHTPNAYYQIIEIYPDRNMKLVGSEQGYKRKHAMSIVKNIKIAYPDKKFKIIRMIKQK